jgi:hypothetical protein
MKNDDQTNDEPKVLNLQQNGAELVEMLDRRITASKEHWDSKYKLDKVTKENTKLYLGEMPEDDEDNEERALDNRIFSSVRTIVPYVTSRITEPEVYPSSTAQAATKFAEDIEKALYIKAKTEKVREKAKFALEDAMIVRRGYLKLRYDAMRRNFCTVEYVPAESIIIDHKAKPYEEPRYFRHCLDKSVEDLLTMFPDMEKQIKEAFKIDNNTPKQELEQEHVIHEDWLFVPDKEEGLDLVVVWSYNGMYLGGMRDPNWRYGQTNFLDFHMMPLVCFNVLNDGRSFIDKTSFVEQAKYLQKNVDTRSEQISKNAGLGSVGMPVVASGALGDDQSQFLQFEGDTVLELDVSNTESRSIRDVFDVWKADRLQPEVYEDKIDSRNGIDNAFGTPNVFRGEQSKNNTLGQDVLVRDQAFGRQQEIVDAIDSGMSRLYPLMAQFLLVYGNEEELFRFTGENSQFDYVLINTAELDTNVQIQVKAGTSMPIDRAQRRATADKAASQKMIDPLTYWEIMDEGNAEKYAKRVVEYTLDPAAYMKDSKDEVFNRDAFVDIQLVKTGQQPPFRESLPKEYFDYLNKYILDGNLNNPNMDEGTKAELTQFIDAQLQRGQASLGVMETQLPTPEEVQMGNEQIDQENAVAQQSQQAEQQAKAAQGPQPTINQPAAA